MSDGQLRYEATPAFLNILEATGCSLVVSVYLQNRIVLMSADSSGFFVNSFVFARPMGLAVSQTGGNTQLAVAGADELVIFADAPLLAGSVPGGNGAFQHLLVPRATLYCGDIDAHDLAWIKNRLYAANTRFSCIAEIEPGHSFSPAWHPPFITELLPEDRCHLNGIAAEDDRVRYVTTLGASNEKNGWSDGRATSGQLIEVPGGNVVLDTLCVPHSPRLLDRRLYVLESGTGRVLQVDADARRADTVAELPGFVRGLDRLGDILFVGLSRIREEARVRLPIYDRRHTLFCGVAAVERRRGTVLGTIRFDDAFEEVFDVKVLPKFPRAGMLSLADDAHRRALVMPGRAFWGEPRLDTRDEKHKDIPKA